MQTIKKKREDVSQYSDPALVTLARSGDGAAFAAIMTRYNQRLYRVARGIVRDESEAEDVLQDAYMRAVAALPFSAHGSICDLVNTTTPAEPPPLTALTARMVRA